MPALKITRVGNSAALLLPEEVLARLRVEQGDTAHDMKLARRVMRKRRNVLRELAK